MKSVTFYVLNQHVTIDDLAAIEQFVCDFVAKQWRQVKRILIFCKDDTQAFRLDEALWGRSADEFIPHNLVGEGFPDGSPIEICWPQRLEGRNIYRDLLINLLETDVTFPFSFNSVIDFVPNDNTLKELARCRYKQYRNLGFHVITSKSST
ncbi:DNA polymerase III, chi subunit [secondary endosymbiont of Heteropsylla cubana]|uniref:DNA polymerase III, chi subunit n=1 Tax=secondary endosymbiont of Heteropsylla cubana TaxID=134287 RepID=J3Z5M2_9ENTR|nr:DNA polymerase III subunit chi [secondary endosymbiont of Heteropsylla cubana]AFP85639.1 DNA polymerase III, chi subunit [secondary endosymbiont of Heteropsylla cubana]